MVVTIRGPLLLIIIRPGPQVKRRWPAPRRMTLGGDLCVLPRILIGIVRFPLSTLELFLLPLPLPVVTALVVMVAATPLVVEVICRLVLTSLLELLVTPLRPKWWASALQSVDRLLIVFPLLPFWTVKCWHLDPPVIVLLNIITEVIRKVLFIAPETLQYLTCSGVLVSFNVPVILPTVRACVFTLETWSTPSCRSVRSVPLPVWLTSRPPLFCEVIWTAIVFLCRPAS